MSLSGGLVCRRPLVHVNGISVISQSCGGLRRLPLSSSVAEIRVPLASFVGTHRHAVFGGPHRAAARASALGPIPSTPFG